MEMYTGEIKTILKVGVVVVGLLGLFLAVETVKSFQEYRLLGSDTPAVNTITVSGTGEAFAKPNMVQFTFSVIEEGKTVEEATKKAAQRENQALEVLDDEGIDEDDIRTLNYNLNPRYEYNRTSSFGGSQRELIGYEVRQTIQVKSDDADEAGSLVSALGGAGVQNISGLAFVVEDEDEVKSEARGKAIDDARAKAEELADQLGVKLVRVVSFNQGGYSPSPYKATASFAEVGGGPAFDEAVIPTGENQFVENVTITYEIR